MTRTALWRRLDAPGHDVCRLSETVQGWELQGTAVFRHELGPADVDYLVLCDERWHSSFGLVRGRIGDHSCVIGARAYVPVAWLDLPEASLRVMPQYYERVSASTYWYEAPSADYSGLLELADSGFVRTYPNLWSMEN